MKTNIFTEHKNVYTHILNINHNEYIVCKTFLTDMAHCVILDLTLLASQLQMSMSSIKNLDSAMLQFPATSLLGRVTSM